MAKYEIQRTPTAILTPLTSPLDARMNKVFLHILFTLSTPFTFPLIANPPPSFIEVPQDYFEFDSYNPPINEPADPQASPITPLVDLEDRAQSFVLKTKKIDIPEYPNAFNPSIIRWRGSLLLCFRIYGPNGSTNRIGLTWLDEEFNPIGQPQELNILVNDPFSRTKRQDPRLIAIGDRLFIAYNNVLARIPQREIRRMLIAEVFFNGEGFFADNPECLIHFEGENDLRSEKNWVPFVYNHHLLLSYSINPHRVLHPLLFGTGECNTVASASASIPWKWGDLRGGTPALLEGDEYLAFFHTCKSMSTVHSQGKNIPHYFMGAYTFSAHPPFDITRVSPEPIVGKDFYHGRAYKTWKPLHVVFPGGFVSDDHYIWIAYGRQDHEIWIAKLNKAALFQSLVPVHKKP